MVAFNYIMKTNQRRAMEKLRGYQERGVEIFIETLRLLVAVLQYTFQLRLTQQRNQSAL